MTQLIKNIEHAMECGIDNYATVEVETMLRALLEENKRLNVQFTTEIELSSKLVDQLQQTREELERVKSEVRSLPTQDAYDAACKALWKHRADNESLSTKLSAIKKIAQNAIDGSLDDAHEALTKIVGDTHD